MGGIDFRIKNIEGQTLMDEARKGTNGAKKLEYLLQRNKKVESLKVIAANSVAKHVKKSSDIWGESRYQVFQRITENANAAMLHFQSPIYPELAVKSFMTYLHSFNSLFSDKCK